MSHTLPTMKTPVVLGLALLAFVPAQAQIFRPASLDGALLGGIAGAIIGNNSGSLHHNAWQGAAIGAGAGLLLGATADANSARYGGYGTYDYPGAYVYRHPRVVRGGYHGGYRGGYDYGYGYGYGGAAADGLWLGALAGGIIGHNSRGFHHNGWRGAAWGAGVGWLLGSIADANAYAYSDYSRGVVVREAPVAVQAQPAAQPQQVTIVNNYYNAPASPMVAANSLFGR